MQSLRWRFIDPKVPTQPPFGFSFFSFLARDSGETQLSWAKLPNRFAVPLQNLPSSEVPKFIGHQTAALLHVNAAMHGDAARLHDNVVINDFAAGVPGCYLFDGPA